MIGEEKPSLEDLEHFGVRGMKWGTRHDPGHEGIQASPRKIAKLDKKFEKAAGSTKTFMNIYNAGADDFNKNKIGAINNKPIYQKAANAGHLLDPNSPVSKKYNAEVAKGFVDSLHKAARSLGSNASGTKQIGVHVLDGSAPDQWSLVLEDIKHDSTQIQVKLTRDAKGIITKIEIIKDVVHSDSLTQGGMMDISEEERLEHFGVLGMHWGKRKGGQSRSNSGKTKVSARPYNPYTSSQHAKMVAGSAAVLGLMIMFGTSSASTRALSGPIAGRGAIGAKRVLELTGPTTLKAVKAGASGAYKISSF